MNLDTIMNNTIEMAIEKALRTRDAKIVSLEESINDLRRIIDKQHDKTRMLKDKVAGLTTSNDLMKQELEAIKFRAEQERDSTTEKAVMKKVADVLYAAAEEDDIHTFDMDSDMSDLFSTTTVTSDTQPKSPVVVAPKKQTGPPLKKARTAATITIAVGDPRRRPALPADDEYIPEDISDFSDDDNTLVKDYSDNCPNANGVGYYEHTYIGGGRRPKCIQCKRDDNVQYILSNDGKGFYVCKTCNMRHHRFHRHDNGRAYNVQTWFSVA